MSDDIIIAQTKKWIIDVVVGCNFCPFAGKEVSRGSIHYEVLHAADKKKVLQALAIEFLYLDENPGTETSLLILPGSFLIFNEYLDLVEIAESFLKKEGHEGKYQLASFHPLYLFAATTETDPANYTNRSPYPMLHLLREASITKAVDNYPGIENIPLQNIDFTTKKGLNYMQSLKDACINDPAFNIPEPPEYL